MVLFSLYPDATYIGIADGADSNWQFLQNHTSEQILDFYHASDYLGAVAVALYPKDLVEQKRWLKEICHQLKREEGGADLLYKQMLELSQSQKHALGIEEKLGAAVVLSLRTLVLTPTRWSQFWNKLNQCCESNKLTFFIDAPIRKILIPKVKYD